MALLEITRTSFLSKMVGKFSGKTTVWLAVLVLLTVFLLLSTLDMRTSLSVQLVHLRDTFHHASLTRNTGYFEESEQAFSSFGKCDGPLKVYMYDIPRKFNLGMLKPNDPNQELPWMDRPIPPWSQRSGLKRQHNVEYWMMSYLLDHQGGEEEVRAAVRVADPGQADVFFMPFFSSLSFNTHGVNMKDPDAEKDRILQVEVVEFLKRSPWWQRSGGRDHVLAMHHPNAFRFVRDELNASIFIVADFGRYSQNVARLRKDVVAPYTHVIDTYKYDNLTDPYGSRTILLFFRGRIKRKDDGIVREKLWKLLHKHPRVYFEESIATAEGLEMATKGMRLSQFCLHPAGDTPSSCRLFDAIVSHCVPVIVSDKIELPFEDEINYRDFCLFFSVEEALRPGYLLNYLEHFPKERWLRMWNQMKLVARHFEYQIPAKEDDALNMIWKQVHRKLSAVRLAIHRSKRLKIPDWWRR